MVSLAASYGLDLYASASSASLCLRVVSTNRYFRTISPELSSGGVRYGIFKIVVSSRGYVVVQARTLCDQDLLVVYSINGARIAAQRLDEFLNAMILDPTEYYVVSVAILTTFIG